MSSDMAGQAPERLNRAARPSRIRANAICTFRGPPVVFSGAQELCGKPSVRAGRPDHAW
jgi:hypothetical protein